MMKRIRLIVTVTIVLLLLVSLMGVFGVGPSANLGVLERICMGVLAVLIGMLLWVVIYYWYGKDYKCPTCGERFCLKKVDTVVLEKEDISVMMKVNVRNNSGDIVGTQEQYVPGERTKYCVQYVCKKCGEEAHRVFTQDSAKL